MTNAEAQRKSYWKNHAKSVEQARQYRRDTPELSYKATRKYQLTHPERVIWFQMRQRCNNPKCKDYPLYGGRGIKLMYGTFEEFIADVGYRPSAKYSIDRIDNDNHYTEGNCRWATPKQQANNRRNNRRMEQL